ncbi:MAG: hypothetical protein DHS80DRAFT_30018 [Piptocephalis tieghemiana]|nr:MAG: hypothetical protein DHS80DRAFT_30018 [Piptocephalis tieghemiana]
MAKLYPRSSLRRTLRAHQPDYRLSKTVDILVYLDYLHFLQRLLDQADAERTKSGDTALQPTHIAKVKQRVLREFKG